MHQRRTLGHTDLQPGVIVRLLLAGCGSHGGLGGRRRGRAGRKGGDGRVRVATFAQGFLASGLFGAGALVRLDLLLDALAGGELVGFLYRVEVSESRSRQP